MLHNILHRLAELETHFSDRYGSFTIYSNDTLSDLEDFFLIQVDYFIIRPDMRSCILSFGEFQDIVEEMDSRFHIDINRLLTCYEGRKFWFKTMTWFAKVFINAPPSTELTKALRNLRQSIRSVKFF